MESVHQHRYWIYLKFQDLVIPSSPLGFLRSKQSLVFLFFPCYIIVFGYDTFKIFLWYPQLNVSGINIREFYICRCTLSAGNIFLLRCPTFFQDKVAGELFVWFLVHLLLSTIGSGKSTICQLAKGGSSKKRLCPKPTGSASEKWFFTKDRLSRHDMVDDGMPCSDSMTVMAFLLPSMTTWPDLFFQTDRGMCVVWENLPDFIPYYLCNQYEEWFCLMT